jgi:hypothetical protein
MSEPNRTWTNKGLLALSLFSWLFLYQFSREFFEISRPLMLKFYETGPGELLLLVFKKGLHFSADNPDFFIKIFFSLIYILSYLWFMSLYFGFTRIRSLLISVFTGFLILSFGLNIAGKILHIESAVLLSRNTNDLMVSPFMLVFLFPVVKLYLADLKK